MPLLVEIYGAQAGSQFIDDTECLFVSDSECKFEDTLGVMRISTEPFAGRRFWSDDIMGVDPIAYRMDQLWGGMVRISGGSIEIALSAFNGTEWWLPAISYRCRFSVTDNFEDTATVLMQGTFYRKNIDIPLSASFDIYPEDIAVNLLSTAVDYDGNTVVLPQAFGAVSYVKPVRLADAGGGNRRYSAGGLQGTKHTHWHVFDDGVDVCSNATAISADVFEYTVTPVGQLTISGSGISTANYDVFAQLCGASWLNLNLMDEGAASGDVSIWQDTQIFVLDFLSQVAAVTDAFFYIIGTTLFLHDMDMVLAYYGTKYYDVANDLLDGIKYSRATPKSLARYKYKTRESVVETIGQYVKETELEETVLTPWSYGGEISIDAMTNNGPLAVSALFNALIYSVGTRINMSLPLSSVSLKPGTKLVLTDNRYTGKRVTCTGHVRDIVYDFVNRKINIDGSTSSITTT